MLLHQRQPTTGKALFNGRDLAGWVVLYGGEWTVENGVLIGRNGKDWSIRVWQRDPLAPGSEPTCVSMQN